MTGFHTWRCMCEGVGRDSRYGHEESHLMHDMKSFHVRIAVVWNVNGCLGAITCAFRWGVTLVGKFISGHCSPRHGKIISGIGGTSGDEAHPRPQL